MSAVKVGQLRRWENLPTKPWGAKHDAEGKTFRVDRVDNEDAHGLYEPVIPAGFTCSEIGFMERHSVVIEEPAAQTTPEGGTTR